MSSPRAPRIRRTVLLALLGFGVLLLAIAAFMLIPILTHQSAGGSGQTAPQGFVSEVSAEGADGRERTLSAFDDSGAPLTPDALQPGERVTVRGTGFDASIGIYLGFCRVPDSPDQRPTPCLGGIPEGATEQKSEAERAAAELASAWVTNDWVWIAFATHTYTDVETGTFEVTLTVPAATGENLDCRAAACGLFTRADHTALNDRVQDLYLPIAFRD